MEEEEKKEAYDNVDILFEDDHVIFVKIYSLTAAKYFGPEYLSRRFNYFSKGDVFVIYDKDNYEHYVLHKPNKYDVNVLDSNQDDVNLMDLEKKYPFLEKEMTKIVGENSIYSVLLKIKNGVEFDDYELNRYDSLITKINYNEKNPGLSKITIQFDNTEDFFKLYDIDESDIHFINSIISSKSSYYYGSERMMYSYDDADNDWREGYLLREFNNNNSEKVKNIIKLLSPNLIKQEDDDEYYRKASEILNESFSRQIDYIVAHYADLRNNCLEDAIKSDIEKDFENPFINYGIIEVIKFYRYVTTVNILLSLFKMTKKKYGRIQDVLEHFTKDKNVGGYEENRYNYSCENFDEESFQNEVERKLDDIIEKLEDSDLFVDVDEYRKILSNLSSRNYEFKRTYKLPKDNTKTFSIVSIDPKTNKLLIQYNNYKGLTGRQERRSLSLEDFNNFLYHPELFESKINKKVITESKLEEIALKWMNKNFSPDQLEIVKSPEYPNSIFYKKNGIVVMEQDLKNKYFWFDYKEIWSFFESFFDMEYTKIQSIMNVWLKEALNLEGYTLIIFVNTQ